MNPAPSTNSSPTCASIGHSGLLRAWKKINKKHQLICVVVSLFLETTRGHYAALLWGWRAVKLTVSSHDIHPELEAFLAMVVQRLCCRGERRNTGVNILSNALILNWPFKSPSCMHSLTHIHKQLAGDRHRQTQGQSFRMPSVKQSVSCRLSNYSHGQGDNLCLLFAVTF